jgi:plasmid stability protein
MATLHVRNVPERLYRRVRRKAARERRSISAETIVLLEQALSKAESSSDARAVVLDRARAMRESMRLPADWPGAVDLLREDRCR